ncbi:hypothetical protein COJ36_07210 [Priestia megaterium]|nr:hypothetical protein COJ36_07210 [Priestia megaterium]
MLFILLKDGTKRLEELKRLIPDVPQHIFKQQANHHLLKLNLILNVIR